jgi:hypothetical protein
MEKLKYYLIALFFLFPLVYLINTHVNRQNNYDDNLKKAFDLRQLISDMSLNDNADIDWVKKLDDSFNFYTIDYQNLLITNKPLLFIGNIFDIYYSQNGERHIVIEDISYSNNLKIDLTCNSSSFNSVIEEIHSNPDQYEISVAVTGIIYEIQTKSLPNSIFDNNIISLKNFTGIGTCLNMRIINRMLYNFKKI